MSGTLANPIPSWRNQDLVLFHATTLEAAENIRDRGVRFITRSQTSEFGQGFYATTNIEQARDFARKKEKNAGQPRSIVSFSIDRERLARLDTLAFVRGSEDALDFWSLVRYCRSGGEGHGRPPDRVGCYDVIFAPVTRNWSMLRLHRDFDQVSFHTTAALTLLNTPGRRRIIVP